MSAHGGALSHVAHVAHGRMGSRAAVKVAHVVRARTQAAVANLVHVRGAPMVNVTRAKCCTSGAGANGGVGKLAENRERKSDRGRNESRLAKILMHLFFRMHCKKVHTVRFSVSFRVR